MAGGGLAVVLHAVEDPFDHVPPLVRLPVVVPWVRAVPLGRHDRRRAERFGQQAGRVARRADGPSRSWSPWQAP